MCDALEEPDADRVITEENKFEVDTLLLLVNVTLTDADRVFVCGPMLMLSVTSTDAV